MPQSPRILAVDDSQVNLIVLEDLLSADYELRCADSGEEALGIACEFQPDIVLLDIQMPGLDGYETCRQLRQDTRLQHTKIILVSSMSEVTDRLEGYAAGADDYLSKPFDDDELLAKIRVFLRLKNAEELDAFKSDVLALINHETRTPLNGILGSLELLAESMAAMMSEDRELLQIALQSAHRMNGLIRKSMLCAELKSGTARLSIEPIDLAALCKEAEATARSRIEGAAAAVEFRGANGTIVAGDVGLLRFVCESLLENALQHHAGAQPIVVALECGDDSAELSVADAGPGIDRSTMQNLFSGFTAADVKHHSAGHGLSLAICKEITALHGGAITAQNAADGGLHVCVSLPRRGSEAIGTTAKAATPATALTT